MKLVHEDPSRDIGGKGSVCQGTDQPAGLFECIRERSRGVPSYHVAKMEILQDLVVGNVPMMSRRRSLTRLPQPSRAHERAAEDRLRPMNLHHRTLGAHVGRMFFT